MKIEELILLHFYDKKEISLQGIGTFRIHAAAGSLLNGQGQIILPENAITFEYNPKAPEDTSLVDAISLQTKKIKSLASADLNSFVVWETQLLNIGMTFTLKGIGTLEKTKEGELKFIPEQYIDPAAEKPTSKNDRNHINFGLLNPRNYHLEFDENSKKTLNLISIIIVASTVLWASFHFIIKTRHNEITTGDTSEVKTGNNFKPAPENRSVSNSSLKDPVKNLPLSHDTLKSTPLSNTAAPEKQKKDYSFKVVFLETKIKDEALKKYNEIIGFGHSASIFTKDSSVFQIAFPFNLPLGDTSRIIDSLDQFYSLGKGFVDIK